MLTIEEIVNGVGQLNADDIQAEITETEKRLAKMKLLLALAQGGTVQPPKRKRTRRSPAEIAAEKAAKEGGAE